MSEYKTGEDALRAALINFVHENREIVHRAYGEALAHAIATFDFMSLLMDPLKATLHGVVKEEIGRSFHYGQGRKHITEAVAILLERQPIMLDPAQRARADAANLREYRKAVREADKRRKERRAKRKAARIKRTKAP
jgi:hypothetical protein